MDTVDRKTRSRIMSAIRSKHTGPERRMARALRRARAAGWRRHRRAEGAELDFSWRAERVGLQTLGCFWHGCPRHYRRPKSNWRFWQRKVDANKSRDRRQGRLLRARGWLVVSVFECEAATDADALIVARALARMVLPPRRRIPFAAPAGA